MSRLLRGIAVAAVLAVGLAGQGQAGTRSARDEQLRYALETMNLHYPEYVARANDFRSHGCLHWDQPASCRKPAPYNHFDWTTDGCSHAPPPANLIFNRPCQLHDFGYRNFGNGLKLDRTENRRKWIDTRFRDEMFRICRDPRASLPFGGVPQCIEVATSVYGVVRNFGGNWATPQPNIAKYVGHIVQWQGDTKTQKTAWLVMPNLHRHWIADAATYYCLKARGASGPDLLPDDVLDRLRDDAGIHATCTPPPEPPPPPPPVVPGGANITISRAASVGGGRSWLQVSMTGMRGAFAYTVECWETSDPTGNGGNRIGSFGVTTDSVGSWTGAGTCTVSDSTYSNVRIGPNLIWSNTLGPVPVGPPPPGPPTGLAISYGGPQRDRLTLSWQAPNNVLGYNLYLDGSYSATVGSTSYDYGVLTCNVPHTLAVEGVSPDGAVSARASYVATRPCPVPPPPPAAPVNVSAGVATNNDVVLFWSAVPGITTYNLYLDGAKMLTLGPTTSFDLGVLACGTTYVIGIQAQADDGQVSAISSTSATTRACGGTQPLIGDLNNDGRVDCADVAILKANYGTSSALGDLNGDGIVNITDLSILLSHWTGPPDSSGSC